MNDKRQVISMARMIDLNHQLIIKNTKMKKIIALTVALCIATTTMFAQTKAGKTDNTEHTAYYSCPKHPEVTGHTPGKCSKCGMALQASKKEQMKAEATKNYTCPVHVDVSSHNPGQCPKCGKKLNLSKKEEMKAQVTKTYTCSMHPDVAHDKEGNCPKCGMALIEKKKK
jgi:transcription initiation factor IIE alpha subunit